VTLDVSVDAMGAIASWSGDGGGDSEDV
jgi:hypothetical protein